MNNGFYMDIPERQGKKMATGSKIISHLLSGLRKKDVDMTEGNISRHIISFALPLLIGNVFQQFYNTVDTWVVGNYVSNEAFSAVGTVGSIINMLIGFFAGLASGAGVVISQYYGAKQYNKVHDAVHTAIVLTLVLGVIFTLVGLGITPFMLELMDSPDEVFPHSKAYLTTYFSGILGLMLYNMGAGILRAVGDSNHPFYFLVVSALVNIALDLVFVLVFNLGVIGVALATVIAQGISAVLVVFTLIRSDNCIKLVIKDLRISVSILMKIIKVGIPAAVQMAITSFSNIFVQSYINYFGADCMSGWTAYSKIDQLILLPMQSVSLAATTFVGQNLGKKQADRAKRGVTVSLVISICSTFLLMLPVMIFAPKLVEFFNNKAEVIEYGSLLLRILSPFYIFCCMNQIYAGALRGSGNSTVPMIIMLISFVAFRQFYLLIVSNIANEIVPIAMGYPAGWIVCSALTFVYYHKTSLSQKIVVDK